MHNLLLVGDDGVVLVDTGEPGLYPAMKAAIATITNKPVKLLINTHWHHDHTGLNEDFVRKEGTIVVAQENVVGRLSSVFHAVDLENHPLVGVESTFPALSREARPLITVKRELALRVDGERLDLRFIPGAHSNTDLAVYLREANIVYLGDLYFGGLFPFIDRASGGSIDGLIAGCKDVASSIDEKTVVMPSHGPAGTRKDLNEYIRLLETARSRIAALIKNGNSEKQVIARKPVADFETKWSWSFVPGDVFAKIVYRSLAEKSH